MNIATTEGNKKQLSDLVINVGRALAAWSLEYSQLKKITPIHEVSNIHVFIQNEEVYKPLLVIRRICEILMEAEGADDWAAMIYSYIQSFKAQKFSEFEAIFYTTSIWKLKWDNPPASFPEIEIDSNGFEEIEEVEGLSDGRDFGDETD